MRKYLFILFFVALLSLTSISALQPSGVVSLNRPTVSTQTGNINYLTGNLTNHSQLLGLYGGGVTTDNMYHLSLAEYNLRNSRYNSSYDSGIKWQYNMTSPFTTWLASFNYNYNQSTPVFTYITAQAPSWLVTYNASYDSGIKWQYNETYSGDTYNASYDNGIQWQYNETYSGDTYNASYDNGIQWQYNETYSGDTYNATYNKWAYNQSLIGGIFNVTYDSGIKWFYNQTYLGSTYNETYANKNSSLWISTGVNIYNRNTGDVGIGTSNPAYKLDVEKVQDAGSKVAITNNDSGTGAYAEFLARNGRGVGDTDTLRIMAIGQGYTATGGFINDSGVIDSDSGLAGGLSIMTRANAPIRFYTNGHTNEVMRIASDGKVGIGTATPSHTLNIKGIVNASNEIYLNNATAISQWMYNQSNASTQWITSGNNLYNVNTGNVGIGLSVPTEKLQVKGNIFLQNDSDKLYFGMAKDWSLNFNGTQMLINRESGGSNLSIPTGNVGIGTSSPTNKLQVIGDIALWFTGTDTHLRMADSSGNYDRTILRQFATNDTYFGDIDANNGALIFRTNGGDRMKISTIGNVGIGTTSPSVELDVERIQDTGTKVIVLNNNSGTGAYAEFLAKNNRGASDTDSLRIMAMGQGYTSAGGFINDSGVIDSDSGLTNGLSIMTRANAPIRFYTNGHTNEVVRFTADGKVGIGTTAPGYKLDVNGAIRASGDSSSVSMYVPNGNALFRDITAGANDTGYIDFPRLQFRDPSNSYAVGMVLYNGNVGIGTTAPTTKLHVVGSTNITQNLIVQGNTTLYGQNFTLSMPNLKKLDGSTACSTGDLLKWETGGRIYCG